METDTMNIIQKLNLSAKPLKQNEVKWRRDGENNEIILAYNRYGKDIVLMNLTAARIFELCDGRNTVKEIAYTISKEFENSNLDIILSDTLICLENMKEKSLVVV